MTTLPVHRIEMPTPYAVGPVNAYLIDAEPLTLVDSGINTVPSQNALILGLNESGFPVEAIKRVLITHAHPDHYGLAGYIQERSGASIYFPRREIARVRDKQMLFAVGKLLLEAGMPLELLFEMDQERRRGPRTGFHNEVVAIDDGDTFDFDGFTLETIHSPGHTGGHVVFFDRASRSLFVGDQLLPHVSPNPLLEPSLDEPGERRRSLKEYLISLERMAELDPSIAYPGHGGVIDDPAPLIASTQEHHVKRKAEVAGRLTVEGLTPYELAQEMYPDVQGYDVFLSVSEVIAHLDLVVDDGDAVIEERDGVSVYRLASS